MGRISHSNILANRKAYERVSNHGFSIEEHSWSSDILNCKVEALSVFSEYDVTLTSGRFTHHDAEVRLNDQTAWLNKLADELDYWQSKS